MAKGAPVTGRQLSIGEFARRSRLPVSTLRYYHELGVLVPARVDDSSGYRYYDTRQLEAAVLVGELRRLGMPPSDIAGITSGSVPLAEALAAHRRRLRSEIDERTGSMQLLDELLAGAVRQRSHQVEVETRSARVAPGITGNIDSRSAELGIRRLVVKLRTRLRAAELEDPPWYGAVFALDLEADPVGVAVFAGQIESPDGSVPTVALPGGDHAVTSHEGRRNLTGAYEAVLDWAATHQRRPNGGLIEEYRPGGMTTIAIDLEPAG